MCVSLSFLFFPPSVSSPPSPPFPLYLKGTDSDEADSSSAAEDDEDEEDDEAAEDEEEEEDHSDLSESELVHAKTKAGLIAAASKIGYCIHPSRWNACCPSLGD